ncbi:caspase family protein, partial [Alphaproteobacteria bacterium]|nr:caspase family protein [Alphaproteobacteria bacterium]MDC1121558.1 caspase family protein [Alphaproteobacteria bacterium]
MFRLFGLLLVGLVLAGCASPTKMIDSGTIKLGMSKHDFESKMFWGTDVYDDPSMENHGGSGYMPNFYDYTIVYGGNRDKIFVFDPKSILVAITDDIGEAEQLVLLAVRSNSKVQDQQSKLATTTPDVSTQTDRTKTNTEAEELRRQLQALKAKQEKHQQIISSDKQKPVINIAGTAMNGPQGTIKGYVRDNTGIAEVRVDGQLVEVDSYGNFMANTYVPQSGINVSIEAVDLAGLSSSMSVRLERLESSSATAITFDRLNPLGRNVASNKDALALIIGVNEYAKTPAKAHYADSDAQVFSDYAIQKLGIPANRVKTLVNNNADESGMLLAVKDWLARANRQGKSDVYVFFAGHGLASDDGEKMYLLPYDGSPRLLDRTAILRDELFADISAANPRSVTVFLDTCYSGTTRGTDMLIASRPIAIRALEQSIPDNFT